MDKDEFNRTMNVRFIFKLESLRGELDNLSEKIGELTVNLDTFKEECLLSFQIK